MVKVKQRLKAFKKNSYIRARVLLRAWRPQNMKEYSDIYLKAVKRMDAKTSKEAKEFLFEDLPSFFLKGLGGDFQTARDQIDFRVRSLHQTQQDIKVRYLSNFLVNRALDATGMGYSFEERRIRRMVQNTVARGGKSRAEVMSLFETLGPIRMALFMKRLLSTSKKMGQVAQKFLL